MKGIFRAKLRHIVVAPADRRDSQKNVLLIKHRIVPHILCFRSNRYPDIFPAAAFQTRSDETHTLHTCRGSRIIGRQLRVSDILHKPQIQIAHGDIPWLVFASGLVAAVSGSILRLRRQHRAAVLCVEERQLRRLGQAPLAAALGAIYAHPQVVVVSEGKLADPVCARRAVSAGNMGGSIARGLAKGSLIDDSDIIVSNPSAGKLEKLKKEFPGISITNSNVEAATGADIVILAVKPWFMEPVMRELKLKSKQILISVAAGISFEELAHYVVAPEMAMFRLIPNTAISELESMTLVAARNTNDEQDKFILRLFSEMGTVMLIPEDKIAAATALTSCGIAYVLKYVQAAMQAGIEMGLRPKDAMQMIAQSLKGAAALIQNNDTHPSVEIDKVTTPGGITIKGINELEHNGFTSAIIKAMKASK